MYELIFWGILLVILIIVESFTAQLVAIWFAAGSLISFVAAACGASVPVQLILFLAVSLLLLPITRPFLKKFVKTKHEATNADAFVGKQGVVIDEINNITNHGRASISGLDWTARSADNTIIPEGSSIRVIRIEGVTAIVSTCDENS